MLLSISFRLRLVYIFLALRVWYLVCYLAFDPGLARPAAKCQLRDGSYGSGSFQAMGDGFSYAAP